MQNLLCFNFAYFFNKIIAYNITYYDYKTNIIQYNNNKKQTLFFTKTLDLDLQSNPLSKRLHLDKRSRLQ